VKLVFFSYYYPPLKAPRATQVSRLVMHSQLPITVICAGEGAEPCRQGVNIKVFPDRTPRWLRSLRQLFCLPDGFKSWAIHTARQVETEELVSPDDVLVTFGQPMSDHLAGLYLKRKIGMHWIAHFSDPWSDNPFYFPIPFARKRIRFMESEVFSRADRLLFTSDETIDLVMRNRSFSIRSKATVLPHAYDPAAYKPVNTITRADSKVVVRYLGNFYRQRNPRFLAEALRYLQRTCPEILSGVTFELIGRWGGGGAWKGAEFGLPEDLLSLRAPVTYAESLDLMRTADILLIIDAPFESSVFFPSKLVDYLGASRPLMAITPPGTSARIVKAAGGLLINPYVAELAAMDIAEALQKYRMGFMPSPPAELLSCYEAHRVAERFDSMVRSLTPSQTDE